MCVCVDKECVNKVCVGVCVSVQRVCGQSVCGCVCVLMDKVYVAKSGVDKECVDIC